MSRMPISRQIETMHESRMFMVTRSGALLRTTAGGGGARSSSGGWRIGSLITRRRVGERAPARAARGAAQPLPLHAPVRAKQRLPARHRLVDAVAIDQQAAIGAFQVLLDVVAVLGEAHDISVRAG